MNLYPLLLALQGFHVLFLCLHDLVPLPPLNDLPALRGTDSSAKIARITLIQSSPYIFGFVATLLAHRIPGWLLTYLLIAYGILFLGELRAWWIPYLLHPDAVRAARYKQLFGNTHSFLPERNGITPNTLHTVLHLATFATLIALVAHMALSHTAPTM